MRRLLAAAVAILVVGAAPAAADRTVGAKANGHTLHLKVGEKLTIRLKECQSCGYSWHTTKAPRIRVLRQWERKFVPPGLPPGAVGGSGTRVLRYTADGVGATNLRLTELAPNGEHAATYVLSVVVSR